MLLLASTSDIIRVVTDAAVTVDVHASFVDNDTAINPLRTNTAISTATTTTVVASPGSGVERNVKLLSIRNEHASSQVGVTVEHYDGTTAITLFHCTLAAGEMVIHADGSSVPWARFNEAGVPMQGANTGHGDVQVFPGTGGTWTKPTAFTPNTVIAEVIGGGGGGGAGASLRPNSWM